MNSDQQARQQALNPAQSFIVQAPAGSGKTELLTQRFLKLLTTVDKNPEEVLAITFTKKAANEMRQRIIKSLQLAQQVKPEAAHKQQTWQLAQAVLEKDQQLQWHLLDNPNRLRIQTIDSLCAYLSYQLPLLSGLGSSFAISDDSGNDYQQAVDKLLGSLDDDKPWSDALAKLLLHLDNNMNNVRELLASMLAHRDQWLPHVIRSKNNDDLRQHLENALLNLVQHALTMLTKQLPETEQGNLLSIANHAFKTDWTALPIASLDHLSEWQALAELCLTKEFKWRKQFNKNNGFPTSSDVKAEIDHLKAMKKMAVELMERLAENDSLRLSLKDVLQLPNPHYDDKQWQILTELLTLLPILVAQLNVIFAERGHVDFVEVTQRALQALESDDAPSDLALSLDYAIKHILVDEFQDTSATQFRLLELLTQAWQNNDGHSLFLVGDPMQSIYRFRAAEVGLFLQAQQFGIGQITLTSLQLTSNFRSSSAIVEWLNQSFAHAMPQQDDIGLGAISYSAAAAVHPAGDSTVHYLQARHKAQQAQAIVDIIRQAPNTETAILVKNRGQLTEIIPALKAHDIDYEAVDIETLAHLPFIQDLCSLTFALCNFANRLAWLSILRAPWCGLLLSDLHALVNRQPHATVWQCLNDQNITATLSADGQQRVVNLRDTLAMVLQQRARFSLATWIKMTWHVIGGPATLRPEDNIADSDAFFELIDTLQEGEQLTDNFNFEQKLASLFAKSKSTNAKLKIMTIHKSKGLEFERVIIPGMEHANKTDKQKLLIWQERPRDQHDVDLLLAPIKSSKDKSDPIYDSIRRFEQRKALYENTRLFYVAATRAKQQLYLCACFEDGKPPANGSFLNDIWALHGHAFKQIENTATSETVSTASLRRFERAFELPKNIATMLPPLTLDSTINSNMPVWQSNQQRHLGNLIHRLLQQLSAQPKAAWQHLFDNEQLINTLLHHYQINDHVHAKQQLVCLKTQLQQSEDAAWILSNEHETAQSELSIYDQDKTYIIDRLIVTENTCWIIDYKTSTPAAEQSLTDFLAQEQLQYRPQLENYAEIMAQQQPHPLKLMLYFPLLDAKIEWEY